ncbi:MAG: helix-turn-helix domain-containing protein [Bacteroidota bacterium]
MPEFIFNNKLYYNPVEYALAQIGGTWKMPILWRLRDKTLRYGELKKSIPHISDKMLSTELKDLVTNGFLNRKAYNSVPPRVEYSITEKGLKVIPIINTIRDFGLDLMEEAGIDFDKKYRH